MTNIRGRWAALVPLLLLTAACAQQVGPGTADGAGESSYPADVPVIRIDYTGGFVPPAVVATRLPGVSVYGDGRVVSQGPVPAIYPGPALPNIQVGKLSAGEVTKLVEQARAAGVGGTADLGTPPITDVATTRFTVRGPVGTEELTVYALHEATGPEAGLTAEQRAARDKLRAFADRLINPTGATTQPYQPAVVAAVAEPWVATEENQHQVEVPWPGPALPGASLGDGLELGCVTVTGPAVRQVIDAAAKANTATPWTSGGKRWTVTLRPLLPDETDCKTLSAGR
ncbi:hypothetical protein K7640_00755 [Micromonospora sp. PLK6-60]|uniref:hypothetical protein n=1 Tax=Micromonospora sp. PLK6-60 TaxID=2873383 RepID=UPI001CA72976|nr:hypothetical protein [Micromonospora sp. PLK6-60]MBY8870371.1 hypothetical protein [Micromonospora sp. PLK6-60]